MGRFNYSSEDMAAFVNTPYADEMGVGNKATAQRNNTTKHDNDPFEFYNQMFGPNFSLQNIPQETTLESIREDLAGMDATLRNKDEHVGFDVTVELEDDGKELLDQDLVELIEDDPETYGSLEAIVLKGIRDVPTIIGIIDQTIEDNKNK